MSRCAFYFYTCHQWLNLNAAKNTEFAGTDNFHEAASSQTLASSKYTHHILDGRDTPSARSHRYHSIGNPNDHLGVAAAFLVCARSKLSCGRARTTGGSTAV